MYMRKNTSYVPYAVSLKMEYSIHENSMDKQFTITMVMPYAVAYTFHNNPLHAYTNVQQLMNYCNISKRS